MELFPIQKKVLDLFKKSNLNGKFYWTGGTMLSFVYLKHRLSVDLDFFSEVPFNYDDVVGFINENPDEIVKAGSTIVLFCYNV